MLVSLNGIGRVYREEILSTKVQKKMKHEIQRIKEAWYRFKELDNIGNYNIIYGYLLLASSFAIVGITILILAGMD